MGKNILDCDYCGEVTKFVPIIQKPTRFCFESKIYHLPQVNNDGRTLDNVCLNCLSEEIEVLKDE